MAHLIIINLEREISGSRTKKQNFNTWLLKFRNGIKRIKVR